MSSAQSYDVIIVGGGLAGCAAALALGLSNTHWSFLLIDDGDHTSFKVGESLPPEARRILQYLSRDLATQLVQDTSLGIHINSTGNASVWESSEIHETYAIMNPFGMGWHLDRAAFDESLRNAVRDLCTRHQSVNERSPCRLVKEKFVAVAKEADGAWTVFAEELGSKEKRLYRSKWVIDATGRKASLAHKLGAKTVKTDSLLAFYGLFACPGLEGDHRTLIEATETGWWYSSQLANNKRIVVYHTDDCDASSKRARKREGFLEMLHTDTVHISQTIEENDYHPVANVNLPCCTSACSSFLEPLGDEDGCWYAVGDAAMAFDPLSSQGMITALRMGCVVGTMVGQKLSGNMQNEEQTAGREGIAEQYQTIRNDYDSKKKYFYSRARYSGDFWMRRR